MNNRDHFISRAATDLPQGQACAAWSVLLPDAAEGLLSDAEQGALERHVAVCLGCARELADAQRGAAWLGLLKTHAPEPPADLLSNILAKTTGAQASLATASSTPAPAFLPPTPWVLPGVHPGTARHFQPLLQQLIRWFGVGGDFAPTFPPRLAMTSAMAFFSICLTLNLLGFSFRNLNAQTLRPAGLHRTVADTGATLVRSFEGIRMVYRVESRVNGWRTADLAQNAAPLSASR